MKLSEYITKHGDFTLPKINEHDVIGRLHAIGMTQYRTKPKPEPKKIDMSVCIESGIENNIVGEYNLVITRKNKD